MTELGHERKMLGEPVSQVLELPDPVHAALLRAAADCGVTPAAWIAAHLGTAHSTNGVPPSPTKTMADRFAGRTGVVASGSPGDWSSNIGERFIDHLEEKKKAGHL